MKELILVGVLALMSSGAWAQSSQGQGAAQAGTNGNGANAPGSAMQSSGEIRTGTTRSNTGMQNTGPNETAGDRPTAKADRLAQIHPLVHLLPNNDINRAPRGARSVLAIHLSVATNR
jgi:hypothetical protein